MAQPQRLRKKRHNHGPARTRRCCSFVFGTYFGHDWDYAGASGPRQGSPPVIDRTSEVIVEIVILAMIAAFLGLRLYSVLGRRAEHEEEPIQGRFEGRQDRPGSSRVPAPPKPDAKADERGRGEQVQRPRELQLAPPTAERGQAGKIGKTSGRERVGLGGKNT